MCFHAKQAQEAQKLENRFQAKMRQKEAYRPGDFNGFTHPKMAVITHAQPDQIQLMEWGLLPHWAKDRRLQDHTLNARIETLHEKPAFRAVVHQRCLVPAERFYEWQWLDEKGRQKQAYELFLPEIELFAFAGIWSEWTDQSTGELIPTFSLVTTQANALMEVIHNHRKRMPLLVHPEDEQAFLRGENWRAANDYLQAVAI